MTGNARSGSRILGRLRSADGKGIVRMEDRFDTDIGDPCRPTGLPAPLARPAPRAPLGGRLASAGRRDRGDCCRQDSSDCTVMLHFRPGMDQIDGSGYPWCSGERRPALRPRSTGHCRATVTG